MDTKWQVMGPRSSTERVTPDAPAATAQGGDSVAGGPGRGCRRRDVGSDAAVGSRVVVAAGPHSAVAASVMVALDHPMGLICATSRPRERARWRVPLVVSLSLSSSGGRSCLGCRREGVVLVWVCGYRD